MRIEEKIPSGQIGKKAKKAGGSKFDPAASSFSGELQVRERELSDHQNELTLLKSEIERVGEELERRPTLENFARFREVIGSLTKKVSREAYRLEKIGGTPMHPSCFEIVNLLDKQLDDLYRLMLAEQKDRISLTNKIIGIKGLVIDLLG